VVIPVCVFLLAWIFGAIMARIEVWDPLVRCVPRSHTREPPNCDALVAASHGRAPHAAAHARAAATVCRRDGAARAVRGCR
jgi:hypothetical protein